ncbi:hypothetical protein TUSST3_30100 [Streptomyces sp. TUS-ST3]|jgi:hypothetical protein|nr:hypothetical protein TUSST3_30100 [Streptomyces sp. TUS-ST3]
MRCLPTYGVPDEPRLVAAGAVSGHEGDLGAQTQTGVILLPERDLTAFVVPEIGSAGAQ